MKNITTTEPTPTIAPVPTMSQNATFTTENGTLVIRMPIDPTPPLTKSGKSLLICSTHGNLYTSAIVNGKPLTVSVNAYVRK